MSAAPGGAPRPSVCAPPPPNRTAPVGCRYIKTYLLPDKSNRSKRKTSVRKRSLDPVFNETLKVRYGTGGGPADRRAPPRPVTPLLPPPSPQYNVRKAELRGRTLNLSVWHHDALGRNLFLGEVEVPLGEWDWANTRPEWFNLQPRVSPARPHGRPTAPHSSAPPPRPIAPP